MRRGVRSALVCSALVLGAACGAPGSWRAVGGAAELTAAATSQPPRCTVIYFALPGRTLSDRMAAESLLAPDVLAALRDGGFRSLRVDGFAQAALYDRWIGGGEGMGICVLDEQGRVLAARPGPQDPAELAAYLRLVAARRDEVAALRAAVAADPDDARLQYRLGLLLLELGNRKDTERCLLAAAEAARDPVPEAAHRLARLYALDGRLGAARRWLARAEDSPSAQATAGYVLYKERRHREAAALLGALLDQGALDSARLEDRLRARLFYGKALHEAGDHVAAERVLRALITDAPDTTFAGAAQHTISHIEDPDHGHQH